MHYLYLIEMPFGDFANRADPDKATLVTSCLSRIYSVCLWIYDISDSTLVVSGAQWLSGRVLDSRWRGSGFEPHRRHSAVSLSKNINPSLVLVQPRKTSPYITERLLMGREESNQTRNTLVVDLTSNLFVLCII